MSTCALYLHFCSALGDVLGVEGREEVGGGGEDDEDDGKHCEEDVDAFDGDVSESGVVERLHRDELVLLLLRLHSNDLSPKRKHEINSSIILTCC